MVNCNNSGLGVTVALPGATAGKFSRLITWPGASTFSGAITLGAAGALAIAITLSTTALAVTMAQSTTGALAVTGTLDPLGACAFIGTCAQDVLEGYQCCLWTLQGLIGVPRFVHSLLAPQVTNAETGATGAQTSTSHCHLGCFGAPVFPSLGGEGANDSVLSPTRGEE